MRYEIVLIAIIFIFGFGSCSKIEIEEPKFENTVLNIDKKTLCQKIVGQWLVYRIEHREADDGKQVQERVGMGPIELFCVDDAVMGKALIGVSSSKTPVETRWAPISSKVVDQNLELSFKNGACEMNFLISEFEHSELKGELSSKNCMVLGKPVNYEGDILIIREN